MQFDAFRLGQTVALNDGRTGVVRFLGQGEFAAGDWIGVELEDDSGKNDGSVQGERYFQCEPGHGMFLRATGIQAVLEEPKPKPAPKSSAAAKPAAGAATAKTRPTSVISNGTRRQSLIDPTAAKRQSINAASPTPASTRRQPLPNGSKISSRPSLSAATSAGPSSRTTTTTTARKPPTKPTASSRTGISSTSTRPSAPGAPTGRPRASISTTNSSNLSSTVGRPSAAPPVRTPAVKGPRPTNAAEHSKPSSRKEPVHRSASSSPMDNLNSDAEAQTGADGGSEIASVDGQKRGEETDEEESSEHDSPPQNHAPPPLPSQKAPKPTPDPKAPSRPSISRTTAAGRQIEELEAKLRLLERKRNEDREKLAALDKLQSERDKFERIIQTLQAKYGPQVQELATLRAKLKESEDGAQSLDALRAEHESLMEMATLDREMAEETAEGLRAELEALKEKALEVELELEIVREENDELGKEMSPEERSSQGYLQMQRSLERYRDALVRLRDMTQAQETEMKEEIASLHNDLGQLDGIQEGFKAAKEQLARSEAAVESLKQQLDAALNAEDMVEELTETNNNLSDELSKLRIEVEELQTINELNDEFESQHLENEKQMQEEIDARGAALAERMADAARQQDKMADYEYTIAKFRELVSNLQTHLADMKASQQLTEAEAEDLSNRSKAMTDLNLKLQISAAKTQNNTIDLEIRRLEAQEALEHLQIIQMFLPDDLKIERNSVLAYLRFKRVAFKAHLLYGFLKDRVLGVSAVNNPDRAFVYCDIMDKLAWIAAVCERFVDDIRRSSVDRFVGYDRALQELEPVERCLNGYIDAWKKDELREKMVVEELGRSSALLSHLAEINFVDDLPSHAEEGLMQTKVMQSNLETAAAALSYARGIIEAQASQEQSSDSSDEEGERQDGAVRGSLSYLENMVNQVRSAKVVVGKAHASLAELALQSMTFSPNTKGAFSTSLDSTSMLSKQVQALGAQIIHLMDPELEEEPLGTRIRTVLNEFHVSTYPDLHKPSTPLAGLVAQIRTVSEQMSFLAQLTGNVNQAEEFERFAAPWKARAELLKSASATNLATESELTRLKEVMQDRLAQLRERDQTLEEQNIRIELLESRTKDARERSQKMEELQKVLEQGKRRETELMAALDNLGNEVEVLRDDGDKLRKMLGSKGDVNGHGDDGGGERPAQKGTVVTDAVEVEALKLEIRSLRGTVKYLRQDNFETRFANPTAAIQQAWLDEPLFKKRKEDSKRWRGQQEALEKQGGHVVDSLIHLGLEASPVRLKDLPEQKLAWRPARERNSWICSQNLEQWTRWHRRRRKLMEAGTGVERAF